MKDVIDKDLNPAAVLGGEAVIDGLSGMFLCDENVLFFSLVFVVLWCCKVAKILILTGCH